MADVKWIKITTDIFDDEKILMIESMPSADSIIVVWFKLLAFAGKQNNNGVFLMSNRIAYTDEMLASIFRRDVKVIRLALDTFEAFGMIERINNTITIPNWNKHQTLDSYEKKKERDRLYQAERRAKQRALVEKSSDSNTIQSSDIAISEEDIEVDIEREEEKEDKIDIIDKIDKSEFSPCKPSALTKELIEVGYIDQNDIYIDQYNSILQELADDYSFEIARSCLWYFAKQYKSRQATDEEGNDIENKVAYFRSSVFNGAERLERANNRVHSGVGGWLYN